MTPPEAMTFSGLQQRIPRTRRNGIQVNETFSSDDDDDEDNNDGPDPPRDISGHSCIHPMTSTPVDSDEEPKRESKKLEHVSTSSTEDEWIRKKDRRDTTEQKEMTKKRDHESTSSTDEGRIYKKDCTDAIRQRKKMTNF